MGDAAASCSEALRTRAPPPDRERGRFAFAISGEVRSFLSAQWEFEQFVLWPNRGLVDLFWEVHDPTQKNRQGNDRGTQYRSAIWFGDSDERMLAVASRNDEQRRLEANTFEDETPAIATEIGPLARWWPAEEYHQKYLAKGGQTARKGARDPIRCYG